MIVFYFVYLFLALIFSIAMLILVLTLSFRESWKIMTGAFISVVLVAVVISLGLKAPAYYQDGVEFSQLVEKASLYFQKRTR